MVAHRRKNLAATRRRVEDEGEDEAALDVNEVENDSLSEASVISDDDDADASDLSEDETTPSKPGSDINPKSNGHPKPEVTSGPPGATPKRHDSAAADTDLMRNGIAGASIKGSESEAVKDAEGVNFEDMTEEPTPAQASVEQKSQEPAKQDVGLDRRRREHDDYKKKRDEDPAFVPNRGAFFMHDHRHAGPAANGFRPFGRGRGGRGQVGGPFSPANIRAQQTTEATDAPWSHDMHEVIQAPPSKVTVPPPQMSTFHMPQKATSAPAPQNRSFSKTTHIANVQIRVLFEGMEEPFLFQAVPVKQHTRLPQHRPPLRRDKPVRISLPQHPPRYIYPSMDRSFIFIPRAMRPNQHNSGRGRGRGYPSMGGYSSRRTSAYGGSVYSPSVAMSRRSSLAHEISRDMIVSPSGSTTSRSALPSTGMHKPVVRLPPAAVIPHQGAPIMVPQQQFPTAVVNLPPAQAYPHIEDPATAQRENTQVQLTMHQPKPQKTVSVADIETPASLQFHPPQQQHQQPFHQQVPSQVMNGSQYGSSPADTSAYPHPSHTRNLSYPSQASTGTPLSHIPERAIHAQPFQPPHFHQAAAYYQPQLYPAMHPTAPAPAGYYYAAPQTQPYMGPVPVAAAPAFIPQQAAGPYMVAAPADTTGQQSAAAGAPTSVQGGTIARESNGMVYYYDSSQMYNDTGSGQQQQQVQQQQQQAGTGYPMAAAVAPQPGGVVGMGGMMTPSPDGYYYPQAQPPQGTVFYG